MISFQVDTRQWERLGRKFAGMPPLVTRDIRQGTQDAGNKTLTQVRRALKEQTAVKRYGSITKRTGGYTASDGSYLIRAFGPAIPIKEFEVFTTSSGVVAYSWGSAHAFQRSFRTTTGRFMARLTEARLPIRPLLGPNLAKELGKGQSREAFYFWTRELLIPAIVQRITRDLGR